MSDTPCKNCSFAVYSNIGILPSQVDCQLHLIEKFEERKINIREVYDDEREFYVIDSVCPYFRNCSSIDNVWKYHNSPDKIDQVYKEVRFNYTLVVYLDEKTKKSSLLTTLKSLSVLTLKPNLTIIMSNGSTMKPSLLRAEMDKIGLPYRLEFSVEPLSFDDCVSIASTKSASAFLTVIKAGYSLHNALLDFFNYKIQNIIPFLVYIPKNKDKNGLTINRNLFDMLGRNVEKPFLEKLVKIENYKDYVVYE